MAQRPAGLAAGLGAVLLFSGIVLTGTGWIVIVNVVTGALIATAASYAAAVPDGGRLPGLAAPIVVALLGLAALAVPFVLGVSGRMFWANLIIGALVTLLALASAYGSLQVARSGATTRA